MVVSEPEIESVIVERTMEAGSVVVDVAVNDTVCVRITAGKVIVVNDPEIEVVIVEAC